MSTAMKPCWQWLLVNQEADREFQSDVSQPMSKLDPYYTYYLALNQG